MTIENFIELTESYFEGLYHTSSSPDITIENLRIPGSLASSMVNKPGGFWLAKGLSWYKWTKEAEFKVGKYLYKVKLKPSASILQIKEDNYKKFIKKETKLVKLIDWNKITKKYDGVQVYNIYKFKDFISPFSMWDVPSVIVFNKNAIQLVEYLGETKKVIEKHHKERMTKKK